MIVKDPPFTICEQIIENLVLLEGDKDGVLETDIIRSVGKTKSYIKKGITFLIEIELVHYDNIYLKLANKDSYDTPNLSESIRANLRKAITLYKPFAEYVQLQNKGKSSKSSARLVASKYNLANDFDFVATTFDNWLKYLDKEISNLISKGQKINTSIKNNPFLWIDENGNLNYDEEAHTNKIINNLTSKNLNLHFIDPQRLKALGELSQSRYDFSKLIKLCEEINDAFRNENFYTIGSLTRAVLDHVPPLFGKRTFAEVANNYGTKSFRDSMLNLEQFSRKISDGFLHSHIKRKESLPILTTVDCRIPLDLLLGEITTIAF